jgi:uncharacterized membrane protein YdbT with pleckstrin-like domain
MPEKEVLVSYIEKAMVPGETLLYQTRHHWIVLIGPVLTSMVFDAAGAALVIYAVRQRNDKNAAGTGMSVGVESMVVLAAILLLLGGAILVYGLAKRNATEMAVTNRRVLIKTGMASRRTLDLMLNRVESIGVEETVWGRMLGYGTVVLRGTGGTPEPFYQIAHPQEFRQQVQQHAGSAGS